jgi:hypothetical protein
VVITFYKYQSTFNYQLPITKHEICNKCKPTQNYLRQHCRKKHTHTIIFTMFTFITCDVKHRHKTHFHPIRETIKNSFASTVFSMADSSYTNSFFHSYIQMIKLTKNIMMVMTKTHKNT